MKTFIIICTIIFMASGVVSCNILLADRMDKNAATLGNSEKWCF